MVLSLLKSGGIKCQASGFNLWVDPTSSGRVSLAEDEEQKRLILRTEAEKPADFSFTETVIEFPGEYEIGGLKIKGYEVAGEGTADKLKSVYVVQMDELNLCFLGKITKTPKEITLDKLENVDILFLPVGSPYLSFKEAAELVKELEPKIVIPTEGKNVENFIKEFGEGVKLEDKLTIKKKDLEADKTKAIWLTAK